MLARELVTQAVRAVAGDYKRGLGVVDRHAAK